MILRNTVAIGFFGNFTPTSYSFSCLLMILLISSKKNYFFFLVFESRNVEIIILITYREFWCKFFLNRNKKLVKYYIDSVHSRMNCGQRLTLEKAEMSVDLFDQCINQPFQPDVSFSYNDLSWSVNAIIQILYSFQ